ncbi:hypothetical protein [Salinivibrio proteolyticus]|uniref:hypothetical protein n=1 Tax=Salinivibrio proteolyticus TaxID=334715 RepID=UPI003B8A90B7
MLSERIQQTRPRSPHHGRTLNDACRELTERVNHAFEQFDSGNSVFVEHQTAKSQMEERKAKIRHRGKQ